MCSIFIHLDSATPIPHPLSTPPNSSPTLSLSLPIHSHSYSLSPFAYNPPVHPNLNLSIQHHPPTHPFCHFTILSAIPHSIHSPTHPSTLAIHQPILSTQSILVFPYTSILLAESLSHLTAPLSLFTVTHTHTFLPFPFPSFLSLLSLPSSALSIRER